MATNNTKALTDAQWKALIANIKAKADDASLANVAKTGAYADLTGAPVLANVATSGLYSDLEGTPTIGNGVLNILRNGEKIGEFAANSVDGANINIAVPTTAAEIGALAADSTNYAADLSLTMNEQTYVVTAQLKDQNGENLGTAQTIDLPLESVVVSGNYNPTTKNVVLTLQGGSTIDFSVADLVAGLQSEINAENKLNPDYVDLDANHQFLNNTQVNKLNDLPEIKAIGDNLDLSADGTLSANIPEYNVFSATANGLVPMAGSASAKAYLAADGTWKEVETFSLNAATTTALGGIIVGDGLNVAGDGTLSVATFSDSEWAQLWA